jgi:hypothetical protein
MNDLIMALTILAKYANPEDRTPTHCEHDELNVHAGIKLESVSQEDVKKLDELGFFWSEYNNCFMSYRFGSC